MARNPRSADILRMPNRAVTPHLKPERPSHFIREWRKHRGLTIERLCDRIGYSQPHISKLENGKIPYNQELLEAVADALNCTPADLLMRDPSSSEKIWSIWGALEPTEREQLLKIAETFRKAS